MHKLAGKVAIVFGAGPNVGGTIAHYFAREGARVAVSDTQQEAADATATFLTSRGLTAVAIKGDATDETDVTHVVAETLREYGRLDIIVNMAGKVHWSSVLEMDLAEWSKAVLSFPTAGMLTTI